MVKMKNLLNGNTWLWERGKFMNRRYLIQVRPKKINLQPPHFVCWLAGAHTKSQKCFRKLLGYIVLWHFIQKNEK